MTTRLNREVQMASNAVSEKTTLGLQCFGLTEKGEGREINEDQYLIADLHKSMTVESSTLTDEESQRLFGQSQGQLLLVADPVSLAPAAEAAGRIAVRAIAQYVLNVMPWFWGLQSEPEDDLEDHLRLAMQRCQRQINRSQDKHPDREGMGTTLTMAYVLYPRAYVLHVGSSRCYLHRNSEIDQITTDHTFVQRLKDEGAITTEQAEKSKYRNLLWNVVGGTSDELSPEICKVELEIGDALLLCTDGLTAALPDEVLAEILNLEKTARTACETLVRAARERGGTDNTTAVVARVKPTDDASPRSEA